MKDYKINIAQLTIDEWRELGFHYVLDHRNGHPNGDFAAVRVD